MSTRSTRDQPFCWQEKKILRLIQSHFKKSSLTKMLMLYQTVTWMDSDFNGKDIKFYTKTISTYSGLSIEFIPKGLDWLERHKVLNRVEEIENGRYKGKHLVFTPELVEEEETPQKTVTGKAVNGETFVGKDDTSEDSSLLEGSIYKEDKKEKSVKTSPPRLTDNELFPKQRKWDESELSDFDKQLEEKEEKKVPRKKEEMSAADKQIKNRVGLAQFRLVKKNETLLKACAPWVVESLFEWMEHKKGISDSMKKPKTVETLIKRISREGEKRTREVLDYSLSGGNEYKGLFWNTKNTKRNGTNNGFDADKQFDIVKSAATRAAERWAN